MGKGQKMLKKIRSIRKLSLSSTFKKLSYQIKGLLYGFPKPCLIYEGLKFKNINCVYDPNSFRSETLVKTWKVAVTTALPDERFETHAAWMLNILLEHTYTLTLIAEFEHLEMRQAVNSYKAVGIINRKTFKPETINNHEQ